MGKGGGGGKGVREEGVIYVFEDTDFGGHAFEVGFVLIFEF